MMETTEMETTLNQLQDQVTDWAKANFGNNYSDRVGAELGSINPLMGLAEECGELFEAKTTDEVMDAAGDIGIFLLNFCGVEDIRIRVDGTILLSCNNPTNGIVVSIGKLNHYTLKRNQNIRKVTEEVYKEQIAEWACALFAYLSMFCQQQFDQTFMSILKQVWIGVVSKRTASELPAVGCGNAGDCCGGDC